MLKFDFSGKTVLVTGATRGIGRAVAEEFADLGATVAGTATSDAGAEAIDAYLNGRGAGFVMNALKPADIESCFNQVSEKLGAPDVLVNNAGITRDGLLMRMKDEDWAEVLQCDLTSHAMLSKLCSGPMMKKRSGRIISITSIVGETGNPGQCNYAAAKSGIIGFSRSLAREIASRGITVNCVAPGFVQTDMTAVLKPEQTEALLRQIPLRRMAAAAEIAAAVVFLASDMASYITGTTIDVNGGMYCV